MSQLTPADLKPHLMLASDYAGDDVRLQNLIDAAEARVKRYVRRDLDAEYPQGWPQDILHAVKVVVAFLDQNREPGEGYHAKHGLPEMVADLLADARNLAG
ncbi:head-tail connector protein [Palleronia caenipelagi]|uniref:Phage gp6-like head-tail connector protein n=1 Tax=Palleronia caenipelagi TaxID=2489174 RepID=A0A547Q690_9RHOB|nr:head-tail connector protein [Palleronia caenipelagi]TRD21906.1 phage gp6-like head-tail connector protein [Palleronia caenipelagi]